MNTYERSCCHHATALVDELHQRRAEKSSGMAWPRALSLPPSLSLFCHDPRFTSGSIVTTELVSVDQEATEVATADEGELRADTTTGQTEPKTIVIQRLLSHAMVAAYSATEDSHCWGENVANDDAADGL